MKPLLLFALGIFGMLSASAQSDTTRPLAPDTVAVTNAGAQPTDTSQYALLYVYRQKNMVGSIIGYDLYVDDSVVCRVKNNSKYVIKLYKEGLTRVWASSEQKMEFKLKVKYGQSYYLKCSVKMGMFVGRPEFALVYPDQGEVEFEAVKGRGNKNGD